MKELIQEQSEEFFKRKLFSGGRIQTLENIRDRISSELYNYYADRDKIIFLKHLKPLVIKEKVDHEKDCKTVNCGTSKKLNLSIFVIDQEINSISTQYSYQNQYEQESKFTDSEESELIQRLAKIEEMLVKNGHGQEIIFDEIEDLKKNFDIGKKNWFQLLKGKLIEMGTEKILEKTVIEESWNILKEGFSEVSKMIQ